MNSTNLKDIKAYHQALFNASVSGFNEKIPLTAMIALLAGKDYKKFTTKYRELLLNKEPIKPMKILVELAKEYFRSLEMSETFEADTFSKWDALTGQDNYNKQKSGDPDIRIIMIIESFIKNCIPHINPTDISGTGDFLGMLFAEITGEDGERPKGIVLTPTFLTDFMTDLENLNYKEDVLLDGACGSGSFLTMAYIKMLKQCEDDFKVGNITAEEHEFYLKRLTKSVYGNDLKVEMALLTLTNFALLGIDLKNVSYGDFFKLDAQYFEERQINKGILNPPFEYAPAHFMHHMVEKINGVENNKDKRFVIICPPQDIDNGKVLQNSKKTGKVYEDFLTKTLNMATLDTVIEVQGNAFQESNISFGTSIFVFDLNKPHENDDKVLYYDFTNTGYEYFKDSGLIDKYETFEEKKKAAIENIKNKGQYEHKNERTLLSFFDIKDNNNFEICLNKNKIAAQDVEETDLTKANQEIKIILKEKQEIIDKYENKIPVSEEFENYLVKILSEVQ